MAKKKEPRLSVIIPIRNTKEYHRDLDRLEKCLASLAAQTVAGDIEVIVADIGSSQYYSRKQSDIVHGSKLGKRARYVFVKHDGPFNISRARNVGLRAARGEYVCATDVDALFAPDFCERLLGALNLDRIVHCQIRDLGPDGDMDKAVLRPPFCYGGCQVVSRKWAESVHGWDEMFVGWGADDTDFMERAVQDGKENYWLDAVYYHQYHADTMRPDENTDANRARLKMTQARQLPIIRNPFEWGQASVEQSAETVILITTFMRDDSLFRAVKLCKKFYPEIPVYVADCGRPSDEKTRFLGQYEVRHVMAPFDAGVTATRNLGMAAIPKSTGYVFIMEDDIGMIPETNLEMLRRVLNADKGIALAGGLLRKRIMGSADTSDQHYEATFEISGRTLYVRDIKEPKWKDGRGVRYFETDILLNVFLMRRFIWDEIKWDERIKSAPEHCDWFLRLKKAGYKAAYAPDVQAEHFKNPLDENYADYMAYRQRMDGFVIFADNWDIDLMWSDWHDKYGFPNPFNLRETVDVKTAVMRDNLKSAATILNRHGCKWWVDAGTCLGAVRDGGFIAHDSDIDIGVTATTFSPKWDKVRDDLIAAGFSVHREWEYEGRRFELSVERSEVKVDIFLFYDNGDGKLWHGCYGLGKDNEYSDFLPHVFTRDLFDHLHTIQVSGVPAFIPNPVERYLVERYGPDWKTPDKTYLYWRDCRAIDRAYLKNDPIVFVGGVWDLLHVGHINMIAACGELAKRNGRLVVGVLTDDATARYKALPIIPFEERRRVVGALRDVDDIVDQHDQDPTADLEALGIVPNYIVHGSDWDRVPGDEYVRRSGGRAVILPYTKGVSTSDIRRRVLERGSEIAPTVAIERGDRIAIGIKTFMREDALWRNLEAIAKHCPYPYRLYIADDGPATDYKKAKYQELEQGGHRIIRLSHDVGISAGRNAIVKEVIEGYVWMTDDDITLADGESLRRMRTVLDTDPDVGLVAAIIRNEISGQYFGNENYAKGLMFELPGGGLMKRRPASQKVRRAGGTENDPAYVIADQVPNSFLAKREVFADVQWDNRIKVEGEHIDFFLSLKQTKWKAAVCLDAKVTHLNTNADMEYTRYRRTYSPAYMLSKWHLGQIVNQF